MTTRRAFLAGLGGIIAAPAIVRASSLMGMPRAPIIEWTEVKSYAVGDVVVEAGCRDFSVAYVMAKNICLEHFGNRIPTNFEIEISPYRRPIMERLRAMGLHL